MQLRDYQTTISEQALSLLVDFKIAYLAMQVRTGKDIKILRHKFINYLYESGFHLFFYEKGNSIYRMVYQQDGFVQEATAESIKKHIKNYIQNLPSKFDSITPNELLEVVLKGSDSYFGKGLIEFLDAKDIDLLKDDVDIAYFPFKNGIVKITKDGAKLLSYGEVGKVVWQSQVIDFHIDVDNDFDYQLKVFTINPFNISHVRKCLYKNTFTSATTIFFIFCFFS